MDLEIVAKKLFDVPYSKGEYADCFLEETKVYLMLSTALKNNIENKDPFFICALDVCLKDLVSDISIDYYYITYTSVIIENCIEENASSLETEELLSFCQSMDLFTTCQVRRDQEAIEDNNRDTRISRDVLIDVVTTLALQKLEDTRKWLNRLRHNNSPKDLYKILNANTKDEKEIVKMFIG